MFKHKTSRLILVLISSLCLGLLSTTIPVNAKKAPSKITVTYTLKKEGEKGDQTLDHKKIHLTKSKTVLAGLKTGWSVKQKNHFITSIAGHRQKPTQKLYWTYTINAKMISKNAHQQKLKNHDKVVFTLGR